jgi:hypothetical protein
MIKVDRRLVKKWWSMVIRTNKLTIRRRQKRIGYRKSYKEMNWSIRSQLKVRKSTMIIFDLKNRIFVLAASFTFLFASAAARFLALNTKK